MTFGKKYKSYGKKLGCLGGTILSVGRVQTGYQQVERHGYRK